MTDRADADAPTRAAAAVAHEAASITARTIDDLESSGVPASGTSRSSAWGWVPTVGAIGPPSALSAVPAEAAAQEALHGVLYLSYADMADQRAERGLTRAQMELVAARVSWLNDCVI